MDLTLPAELIEFRAEVRTWLGENVPREVRPISGPDMLAFDGQNLTPIWTSKEMRNLMNNSVFLDGEIYGIDSEQQQSTNGKGRGMPLVCRRTNCRR